MEIKATDVAKLRKMTGAGMMDCKKALVEAEGDFEKAKEIIREKGKLVAAKRADRETTEGSVIAKVLEGNQKAILVSLGCETDFVAKNDEFTALANAIAEVAATAYPATKEDLLACKMADGRTVEQAVTEQTGKSGEKHVVACYYTLEAPYIGSYIHINHKIATVVGFNKEVPADLAKHIAMQITAMNPVAVNSDSVPAEVVEKELAIAIEKTKEEQILKAVEADLKKAGINPAHVDSEDHIQSNTAKGWITPEQADLARQIIKETSEKKAANLNEGMIQNIAKGRLAKFFKEQTLEDQEFVMVGKISVKDHIASIDKDAKVVAFQRFSLTD
ncbi:MAG: elongation factor Ts [Bacteroidales bacterium]|nr:elongation factor Ts [Bacteroidales bacterium]